MNDLYQFDPHSLTWTNLSNCAGGSQPPMPRDAHGITGIGDKLYIHGGLGIPGQERGTKSIITWCCACLRC